MSEIATAVAKIRAAYETVGLTALAREAGVPPSTLQSFAQRSWSHNSLEQVDKLLAAAERINERKTDAAA